ncbi:MAG: LysM peptidoglycan-binding domain-containing protein, partial [Gemmatimonadales bacterium]
MLRTFSVKWLGILALALSPAVAHGQQVAAQTHTVHQGDTLWDLAKQYRGDPFLWPDIYRMNTAVVEDPHWIYPGEVLRLAGAETVASVPSVDTPAPTTVVDSQASDAQVTDAQASDAQVVDAQTSDTLPPATREEPASQASLSELTRSPSGEGSDEPEPLFGPRPANTLKESIQAYTRKEYRPLRQTEFYSSGFLTEKQDLPWAKVIGPVSPSQIGATSVVNDAMPFVTIAIQAPRGATYQIGDTLLLAHLGPDWTSYGQPVLPTGLARVTDTIAGRYLATVVAVYGPIRPGQSALPAEKFTPAGAEHAVAVSDGIRGKFLGGPTRQDLKVSQMVVFIDKGKQDGVAAGDIFEIRRKGGLLDNGRVVANEPLATLQIVHVRDHTATGRLLNVL